MSHENPQRASDVAFRAIDGEMLLVSAGQGRILSVNSVGAFVWELLDGDHSISGIVHAVQRDFEVDEMTAREDVTAFLTDLRERGFMLKIDEGARS